MSHRARLAFRGLSRAGPGRPFRPGLRLLRPLGVFGVGTCSDTDRADVWVGTPGWRIAPGTLPTLVAPVIGAVAELARKAKAAKD